MDLPASSAGFLWLLQCVRASQERLLLFLLGLCATDAIRYVQWTSEMGIKEEERDRRNWKSVIQVLTSCVS
jgi:hypothetical protein